MSDAHRALALLAALVFPCARGAAASARGEPTVLLPFDGLTDIINPRGAPAARAAHE